MNIYEQPYTIPGVTLRREENEVIITLEAAKEMRYQLFVGSRPQVTDINQTVAESMDGSFRVSLPVDQGPYYFIIKGDGFSTNIFSERVLQLKQAINVRDMGGYETEDGRFVKWGKLYRGDQLSKLEQEDIQLLENIGLRSIADYRSKHECTLNPNKVIGTVKYIFFCDPKSSFSEAAANVIDLHEENVKMVQELERGEIDARFVNGKGERVILSYQDMVLSEASKDAYGRLLKACADPEHTPLLHHCRGGKDRTGFGAMMLLLLLGVKREQIIEDYIMTGVIRKARNQLKFEQYRELTDNQDYLDYLMSMIETRREYIEAGIDKIASLYDSIDDYLIEHFDMTAAEIAAMRDYYLEEGVTNG